MSKIPVFAMNPYKDYMASCKIEACYFIMSTGPCVMSSLGVGPALLRAMSTLHIKGLGLDLYVQGCVHPPTQPPPPCDLHTLDSTW